MSFGNFLSFGKLLPRLSRLVCTAHVSVRRALAGHRNPGDTDGPIVKLSNTGTLLLGMLYPHQEGWLCVTVYQHLAAALAVKEIVPCQPRGADLFWLQLSHENELSAGVIGSTKSMSYR